MCVNVILDSHCTVLLKESARHFIFIHLKNEIIFIIKRIVSIITLFVHPNACTIAITVGLSANADITHEVATFTAMSTLFLLFHNRKF